MGGNLSISRIKGRARSSAFRDLAALVKVHLSLYISLTAVAGHALCGQRLSRESLLAGAWVLLLSCGAGVLNNIQDRALDRSFSRTRHRVLARGSLGPAAAFWAAGFMIVSALWGLYLSFETWLPVLLGTAGVICYNGLYTPMKKIRHTAVWAMVPGTLSGMLPPAMGWTAVETGMAAADLSGLVLMMAALALWQMPHFLLMELRQRDEKAASSCPGFSALWSRGETLAQIMVWTCLFSLSILLFLCQGWIAGIGLNMLLFCLALGLPAGLGLLLGPARESQRLDLGFWLLNLAMLCFVVIILIDRF